MKLRHRLAVTAMFFVALSVSSATNAALVSVLGGQAINDTDLNITWLADANYAKTEGYAANGVMDWTKAQSWIASLNAENGGLGHLGYNNWRLPISNTCVGYNCTGSEMGHLFYNELGGVAGSSIATTHNANYSLFQNLVAGFYWSGTVYPTSYGNPQAWAFLFSNGVQAYDYQYQSYYAFAVRDGQVGVVPVPAAVWLFGSGLVGLLGFMRRRNTT